MTGTTHQARTSTKSRIALFAAGVSLLTIVVAGGRDVAAQNAAPPSLTFSKDIAPILQRSCQACHHTGAIAPMSLMTYEEVRPWARSIKSRTSRGPRAGAMPPWFVDKSIGIQHFKNDTSLSAAEVEMIGNWVDSGAPQGDPA